MQSIIAEIAAINKEWKRLGVAQLELRDDANATDLKLTLTPQQGDFAGARISFNLNLKHFPENSPKAKCLQSIYHCNIGAKGSVCFNMLSGGSGFSSHYSLDAYVNGLVWLLDNPNSDSAMRSTCIKYSDETRRRKVQLALRGLLGPRYSTCAAEGAERLQITEAELSSWIFHSTNKWWSMLRENPYVELPELPDIPQVPVQLLRTRGVNFRAPPSFATALCCSEFRDLESGVVLVLSTKYRSQAKYSARLGCQLSKPSDELDVGSFLLPKELCRVYIDKALPLSTAIKLHWTNSGPAFGLELRRENKSLPHILHRLYKRQSKVKSIHLVGLKKVV